MWYITKEVASHFGGKKAASQSESYTLHDDMEGTWFKDYKDMLWIVSVTIFTIIVNTSVYILV